MSLGERIKTARERLGLSQTSLAEAVGATQSAVSDLERSVTSEPGAEKLIRLAEALHLDPRFLLFGDETTLSQDAAVAAVLQTEEQEDQRSLLLVFQRLSPAHKRALLTIARALRNAEQR